MLELIKLALRYKTDAFDNEIAMYVHTVNKALNRIGVDVENYEDDDAIASLYIAYCKSQLNFQGEGERWRSIYHDMLVSFSTNLNYK